MNRIIDSVGYENRNIKWFHSHMFAETMIVDDDFQRRYVWVERDYIALIESIILGYPIPELYVWESHPDPNTGDCVLSIVDGQQRINSVYNFLNDGFALKKAYLDVQVKEFGYEGKLFSELPNEIKSKIWDYKFAVRFIKSNITKEEIKSIFLRLNRTSYTLNPEELRNAEFNGEFLKLANKLANLDEWVHFKIFSPADLRRMGDITLVSTLLIFIRKGIDESTTQKSLNQVYDLYNETYDEAGDDELLFKKIVVELRKQSEGLKFFRNILSKKTHFYSIFVFVYWVLKHSQYKLFGKALDEWFEHYECWDKEQEKFIGEGRLNSHISIDKINKLIKEYYLLNQEGTSTQKNRSKRFQLLKSYIELY